MAEPSAAWRWQAPPGWPDPPPGYRPPPGWQPDPAWPPPPPGWSFWVGNPVRLRTKVLRGLLVGVSTLLIVGVFGFLVFAQAVLDRQGCGSVDPTDPANYSVITINNDLDVPIVLDDCPGAECLAYDLPVTLQPGQRYTDHAACKSHGPNMTSWRARTTTGRTLGFIAVDSPRSVDGLTYRVSQASPDRATATAPG